MAALTDVFELIENVTVLYQSIIENIPLNELLLNPFIWIFKNKF